MEMSCADCGCLVEDSLVKVPCARYPDCCCAAVPSANPDAHATCACCGHQKSTVRLWSRDEVNLCRDCLEGLLGRIGVTSTPTLPVRDLDEAVGFYERAGFGVRRYVDPGDGGGDGFAFVDVDGQSVFDLDVIPELDVATNRAGCYLITADTEQWHARLVDGGFEVTSLLDQPWGMREFTLTDPFGNHIRIGRSTPPGE